MTPVSKINEKLLNLLISIMLFSCTYAPNKKLNTIEQNKGKENKLLIFDLNFELNGNSITQDKVNWKDINVDSSFIVNLKSTNYLNSTLHFNMNLVASRIPFLFQLKKVANNKIAFLVIHQFNTIHIDSIILKKGTNQYYRFNNAYHIICAKNGINYITPINIKIYNDTIKLDLKLSDTKKTYEVKS